MSIVNIIWKKCTRLFYNPAMTNAVDDEVKKRPILIDAGESKMELDYDDLVVLKS